MNNEILTVLGIILSVITLGGFLWLIFYIKKILTQISLKEKDIFAVKDQIDNLEVALAKKMNGYVSQPQLDKLVARDRKPLEAKLEKLKMERQFLLDRIPIFGLIKK